MTGSVPNCKLAQKGAATGGTCPEAKRVFRCSLRGPCKVTLAL